MERGRKIYLAVLLVSASVFFVSFYLVVDHFTQARTNQVQYDDLALMVDRTGDETVSPTEELLPEGTEPAEVQAVVLEEYRDVLELNPDLVGWLRIPDTRIDYPVVCRAGDDEFYLDHDFYGKKSSYGCLFVQGDTDVNAPSDNVTIFGHHMRNGTMFGGLDLFLRDQYCAGHDLIYFDTVYERHTYRIFAVFTTTATVDEGFAYHGFVDAASEADFESFVGECKKLSVYKSDIFPVYGDKILCLSTCAYTQENGRLVVAAVRIA